MTSGSTRWILFALGWLIGCGGAAPRAGYRSDGIALDADQVRADVAIVEEAMHEAYAGRAFMTSESWGLMLRNLSAIPTDRQTSDTLCAALAEVLRPARSVSAVDRRGEGCLQGGPGRRLAWTGGANIAASAAETVVVRQWQAPAIVAIGLRSFDGRGALPAGALQAVDRAEAVVLDFRNAAGDDPRPVLPLVEALLGVEARFPLRAIEHRNTSLAATLRSRIPRAERRNRAAWEGLCGSQPPSSMARPETDTKLALVLLGGVCDSACRLVVRMLDTRRDVHVVSGATRGQWPFLSDEGLVHLPHSRSRVSIPTVAYLPSDWIKPSMPFGGSWSFLTLPPLSGFFESSDLMDKALAVARTQLDRRARIRRFEAHPPPPCASFSSFATPDMLPSDARKRLAGGVHPDGPVAITAYLTMTTSSAQAYVAGCPGLEAAGSVDGLGLAVVDIRDTDFEAISRLLQSEAVEYLSIEMNLPPDTT